MQNIDTVLMSLQAIRTNKLRSSLTLVGIILGVASIIAVMTGISVVQGTMEKEMSVLGAQTFQVQKWPTGFSTDEDRRKAMRRPPLTLADAEALRDPFVAPSITGVAPIITGGGCSREGYLKRQQDSDACPPTS